ncbi:hypothetical protein Neosp_010158 [[Neocosmospora] mangrovei]
MSKEMGDSHHGGEDAKDFHVGHSHETLHRVYNTWTVRWLSYVPSGRMQVVSTTVCGCSMNSAQIIASVVSIHNPTFVAEKHLPAIAVLGGIITLGGGLAWAISFLALAPKHTASFVFTHFINNSGYTSSAWTGIMSFYTPIYALYGTDGILHIAEEMRDAPKSAPVSAMSAMKLLASDNICDAASHDWFVDILDSSAGGSALVIVVIVLLKFVPHKQLHLFSLG